MKKTLFILVFAFLAGWTATAQITDTSVSMTPSNRNVLLEEYTGVSCTWCPDGHRMANELKATNPDRICLINIHQGSFANNTYTTQFGNALANQTGLDGYPSGTVNRHVFSGSNTALNRGDWASSANQILNMSSPVNIAAEGTLDWATRTVNIRVQLYYTASQSVSSNALNIAITQDNVYGAQTGKEKNPDQVVGNQYRHMHMLRHLITGQWGETINDIAQGTLVEKNYEYVIPAQLGSPNAIDAVLADLHFLAFVCEGHQEVLTSIEIPVQHINLPAINTRLMALKSVESLTCDNHVSAKLEVMNAGADPITTMDYTYTLSGNTVTNTWNGNIPSMQTVFVTIPDIEITLNTNNNIQANITTVNGEAVSVTSRSVTVKKSVYSCGGNMNFILKTDNYGTETTFNIFGPDGNVVLSGGPFTNSSTVHEFEFNPSTIGCYRLEVYDAYGDGINSGYGVGYFQLNDANGNQIFKDNGQFGAQATYLIDVTYPAGIEDITVGTTIYPNPATDVVNINSSSFVQRVEIFNMQGQLVKVETGEVTSVSVKDLANGMYTLKLTTDNGTSMHKIIKK